MDVHCPLTTSPNIILDVKLDILTLLETIEGTRGQGTVVNEDLLP